jgi:hypothetical protein
LDRGAGGRRGSCRGVVARVLPTVRRGSIARGVGHWCLAVGLCRVRIEDRGGAYGRPISGASDLIVWVCLVPRLAVYACDLSATAARSSDKRIVLFYVHGVRQGQSRVCMSEPFCAPVCVNLFKE